MARMEKLAFDGHGGTSLAARLDLPTGDVRATALFAHCFTCGKDILAAKRVASRLAELGIATLRFDFTGLGHSAGEFANTTFATNVDDLILAAEALTRRLAAPQLLIGHSLGGAAVVAAAARIPSARAVATIGAPADTAHVLHNLGGAIETIRSEGQAEVQLGGRAISIGRGFVEDVETQRLADAAANLKRPLLILHAPLDGIVGVENATALFVAAKHPKSFVSLDDADHLLSRSSDADYAAQVIAAWVERYLEPVAAEPTAPPEGVVRACEADPAGFLQEVRAGQHHLVADEPRSYGGTDLGMSPYQLLAAALATCTSMTIRMYARKKGIALEHVGVDVTHDKIHAADCGSCETTESKVDRLSRVVHLQGELDDATRAQLLAIADRCPVHRTLESEILIETAAG
ncbi:MAG: bifunctional alpha/beta hydrolase/OsmC family protein [Pseudomonadota bacterium]